MSELIHAPATAPGRAAIAIVRLSGAGAGELIERMTRRPLPEPRRASLRRLWADNGEVLDQAVVIWTPGPNSFTGEDAAELHVHGGRAVIATVLAALEMFGSRLARPGEFSRRAFENGRLDLTEAEAVADLVDAETRAQRRQALAQLGGSLSRQANDWRRRLIEVLAHLEAAVDFPDEDLPADVAAKARPALTRLRDDLAAAAVDRRGEQLREGLRVALIGAPNAGKSSLLNALAGRDAAIVTSTPGTTRDVLEVRLELAGAPALLADTAGLRETEDAIEGEGVRRARAWAEAADLRVWVVDGADSDQPEPDGMERLLRPGDLQVVNKADLPGFCTPRHSGAATLATCAHEPASVQRLRDWLEAWAEALLAGSEPPAATRERHRERLRAAVAHLNRAVYAVAPEPELLAEDVRLAARALDQLTGRVDAEAVLGEVFGRFCIGK